MSGSRSVCKRCYFPSTYPGIEFDRDGVCSYCATQLTPQAAAERDRVHKLDRTAELMEIAKQIRAERQRTGSKYDCLIGASGGLDSTYVVYVAKRIMGLDPLVVKYNNGVTHERSDENLLRACQKLGVECRIEGPYPVERKFLVRAVKALRNIGVYFTACFSCHYTILSLAYRVARQEKIHYRLCATNEVERTHAVRSHGFMLRSLIKGFFRGLPFKSLSALYHGTLAAWHLFRLKMKFDGFTPRLIASQFRLHPRPPRWMNNVDISDYIGWDMQRIEQVLRSELDWRPPRDLKVPYLRYDCYFSGLIDLSWKRVTGITTHAALANYFIQAGYVTKEEMADDIAYLDGDEHMRHQIGIVEKRLGVEVR